jgi:tryptophan-rich sensory protein
MTLNNFFKFIISISLPILAGIIGSIFTTPSIDLWYSTLIKPALNPPSWVFAPTWTILYVLMGISMFLVWKKGFNRKDVKIALLIFITQLILNTLWSIIFFAVHSTDGALIEIVLLWFAILATIIAFAKISKLAAWLLVPYILWVSFASYLTYYIWVLN